MYVYATSSDNTIKKIRSSYIKGVCGNEIISSQNNSGLSVFQAEIWGVTYYKNVKALESVKHTQLWVR